MRSEHWRTVVIIINNTGAFLDWSAPDLLALGIGVLILFLGFCLVLLDEFVLNIAGNKLIAGEGHGE